MNSQELQARLNRIPRLTLADYPTPLEFLPRLSGELKRPVYIKRDDEIGPGMGGNKTRKLEYLLAEAASRGARKVVTFGGLQSNHARLTAAAARQIGMEPHLFYFAPRPARLNGNLLLNQLLGAHLHFIPLGAGGDASMTIETTIRLVRWVSRLLVGPNYFIPVGGHSCLGCYGYVRASAEIDMQAQDAGLGSAWLITAAGSGGTLAGLVAGLRLLGSPLYACGIDVGRLWKGFPASIARLASEICVSLGSTISVQVQEVPIVERRYVGAAYAVPSLAGMAALRRLACLEGILLDPVYTAKAFAGLLDMAASVPPEGLPHPAPDQPVIFLHTGGAPALFA